MDIWQNSGIRRTSAKVNLLAIGAVSFFLILPNSAFAQGFVPCGGPDQPNCELCHLAEMGNSILLWLVVILTIVAGLIFAVAGLKLVTSGGNPAAKDAAKGMFVNVIIGYLIVLAAWLIIDTIMRSLVTTEEIKQKIGPWNEIRCVAQVSPREGPTSTTTTPPAVPSMLTDSDWRIGILDTRLVDSGTTPSPLSPTPDADLDFGESLDSDLESDLDEDHIPTHTPPDDRPFEDGDDSESTEDDRSMLDLEFESIIEPEELAASSVYDCGQTSINVFGDSQNYTSNEFFIKYFSHFNSVEEIMAAVDEEMGVLSNDPAAQCMGRAIANGCEGAKMTVSIFVDYTAEVYITERNDGVCGLATVGYPMSPAELPEGEVEGISLCSVENYLNASVPPSEQKDFSEWQALFASDPTGTAIDALTSSLQPASSVTPDCVEYQVQWDVLDVDAPAVYDRQDSLLSNIDWLIDYINNSLDTTPDSELEEVRSRLEALAEQVRQVSALTPDVMDLLSDYESEYASLYSEVPGIFVPGGSSGWATVVSDAEIAVVIDRIRRGVEPQASAYRELIADANAAQSFSPNPPATMYIMGGYETDSNLNEMRTWLSGEANAVYASALAYRYSGNVQYAEKAREIINAWASRGTSFTGNDRGLQLGSYFSYMLYAADLLKDYPAWTRQEREQFESWWRSEVLVHTRSVMSRTNNWGDAGLIGVLSAAVVFRDEALLNEGINRLDSYFEGDWKIRQDSRGTYLPAEVTRNDGSSGVTYMGYAFTSMVQALEIARYAGYDFWQRETTSGASLKDAIWWYFRWNNLAEPFPWNDDPKRTTSVDQNTIEIASNHLTFDPAVGAWLASNRPVAGRRGDRYATLNKGNIAPVSAPVPSE